VKVRRHYHVKAPTSHVAHKFRGHVFVEGELTDCGIRVQKGWLFWPSGRRPKSIDILMHCKRCDRASA
jgi:hypothetical protein